MPRVSGKTTLLIKESAKTGRPIIAATQVAVRNIESMAKDMGIKIPEPISATSWNGGYYRGSNFNRIDGFLIDEVDSVLANIFGKPIVKVTYTPEKTDLNNVLEKFQRSNINLKEPIVFATSTKEEKSKMSKFKVGDIVRVKSIEELEKVNPSLTDGIKKMASTNNEIVSVFSYTISKGDNKVAYFLGGQEGYYFDDSMLEDRVYTKNDIFDINVIVPNKVVEIEFYDGKEKMICHESDTFDLKKCCFIAIAKHLYKKEYTYEGIEYMAEQLMYLKKYVKIVDRAMKDYKKKMDELNKRAKKEEEMKVVHARQAEKKRRYKERRTHRYREDMIDLIADSINEARARRKAKKWQVF